MVLTEEQQTDYYPASTLEGSTTAGALSMVNYEKQFYTIDNTKIVAKPWTSAAFDYVNNNGILNQYPAGYTTNTTATSTKVYKLNATTNTNVNKTGLGIVLRVMAGDNINIFGKSYHKKPSAAGYSGTTNGIVVSQLINAFAATGIVASKGVTGTQITGQAGFPTTMNGLIGTQPAQDANRPKAAINWIVFDEQFKWVSGGFDMVGTATNTTGTLKTHDLSTIPTIAIPKNGYIYVWASNESKFDVFFDNLQLVHNRGPLVSESHFSGWGLELKGISASALNFGQPENKRKFNKGSELQNKEFSDGSGLEWYATQFRSLDPQLGRFWQIDPKPNDAISLYASMENNPIRFNDPLGDSINRRSDQRTAARIEANINGQITRNNQSITNSQNTITSNNAKLTKLRADVASGSLTGKDLKSANKEISKLESSNSKVNANVTEMQGQNAQLNQSLTDINALRNDNTYNYTFGSSSLGAGRHGVVMGSGNDVIIEGSNEGLYVHEMRHIGQSLSNGGLRFSTNSNTLGRLLNAGSNAVQRAAFEVDTYQAQFSLYRNSYPAPGGARVLADINVTSLKTIKDDDDAPVY
jgi:RHS repeat-associated protein